MHSGSFGITVLYAKWRCEKQKKENQICFQPLKYMTENCFSLSSMLTSNLNVNKPINIYFWARCTANHQTNTFAESELWIQDKRFHRITIIENGLPFFLFRAPACAVPYRWVCRLFKLDRICSQINLIYFSVKYENSCSFRNVMSKFHIVMEMLNWKQNGCARVLYSWKCW